MAKQTKLFKGESMEEKLRNYFLKKGYYVLRSVVMKYGTHTITDIDLYLYQKSSPHFRTRVNVDIKNKKTPQAIERVFWTLGLKQALKLDNCIVATTDRRDEVKKFGKANNVVVLDGNFLSKLPNIENQDRLVDEEILGLFKSIQTKTYNGDWRVIFNKSKTRALYNIGFSSLNQSLIDIKYLFEKILVDPQKSKIAVRLAYLLISHFLVQLDFILHENYQLTTSEIKTKLDDGLKFGNLGKEGIERTVQLAMKLTNSENKEKYNLLEKFGKLPTEIISEYFSKPNVIDSLFDKAKEFENEGYLREIKKPTTLNTDLKSIIGVLADYHGIRRKSLFE